MIFSFTSKNSSSKTALWELNKRFLKQLKSYLTKLMVERELNNFKKTLMDM